MPSKITGILRAVAATPWAIQEEKLVAMLEFLTLRANGGVVPAEDVARITAQNRDPKARTAGRIAVLPLYGVVAQRMNIMTEVSGGTSTEKFAALFEDAVSRPDIDAIVIDVDSPGGSVEGTPDLAARILSARGKKPIIAIANSLMASAAYWIASAADEIVLTSTAQVGSIGVFTVHQDVSEAAADAGIKHTIISAGKYKTEGTPFEPLTDGAKAAIQSSVDEIYGLFVAAVAKHRGVSQTAVRDGYGQGRALLGRAAVKAGLADRVGTLDSVLAELGAGTGRRSRIAASIASARHDHAGEELAAIDKITVGPMTAGERATVLAALDGPSLAFRAAAPHNDRYLAVQADDFESAAMCSTCGALLSDDGECPNGHEQPEDDDYPTPLDNQSQRAAEGAAARALDPTTPTRQAPAPAKEQTVPTDTAPQNGASAPTSPAAPAADYESLLDLAAANGKTTADVKAWIAEKKTVMQVQADLLSEHRAKNKPIAVSGMKDNAVERPFLSFGDEIGAIITHGRTGRMDPRLARFTPQQIFAGSASGMNETVGSEGGFFIQPELLSEVIDPIYKDDPILSRVTRVPIGSNTNGVKYNVVDETSRATGSRWGGVSGKWGTEASTLTSSKPTTRLFELNLKKLTFLGYLTDELTMDTSAAQSLMTRAFQAELQFMLADAIFRGTGGGMPQGFMNSGALVKVAIEGSQTIANSAQYLGLNIPKMLMAVPAGLQGDVIWIYQQELLPYLLNAQVAGSSAGAAVPVFVAMGGFTNRPFDMILGRPAFVSELAEAVGTPGDLLAVVPSQYHLGEKGGAQMAQSIHVKFTTDELTLRWIYRVDGASVWRTAVTPYKGAVSRSPWVSLNTRT